MSLSILATHDAGCRVWLGSSFYVSHAGKVSVPSGGCSWNRISLTSLACGGPGSSLFCPNLGLPLNHT